MGFFKKIHAFVDPIGAFAASKNKKVNNWYKGLDDVLHLWNPSRVKRGIQRQWDADPLGKQLNKMFFPSNHSAQSVYQNTQVYGPTGSIVGRY